MTTTVEQNRMSPQEAGYDANVIARLDQHFANLINDNKIHCASYLLSRDGKVFADGALGQLHYEQEQSKFEKDSIRRIASITKLFTAVAIFQLIEQGKIYLRQSVSEWIEEFKHPMFDKINIMHLLTHTSGLRADPGYYLEPYPYGWGAIKFAFEPETEGPDAVTDPVELEKQRRNAWIKAILAGKPLSSPGEEWNYSSAGYNILGELITRVSGLRYEDYVMEHIVKPLGLTRTFFEVPESLRDEVCIINKYEKSNMERGLKENDSPRAGGGLYSSLGDLFRFGQMLLNDGTLDGVTILSRKSVEKMRGNILDKDISSFCWGGKIKNHIYGLGPVLIGSNQMISENTYGHEGAGRCILLLDPSKNAVMLFFVPSNTEWCPESMIGTQNIIGAGWL